MAFLVTFALLFICGHLHSAESESYLNENEDFEARLDTLTNEVTRLKDQFEEIQPSSTDDEMLAFMPLEAKREVVQEGIKFTVKYWVSPEAKEPEKTWLEENWSDNTATVLREYFDNDIHRTPADIYTTSVITQQDTWTLRLFLESEKLKFTLNFKIDSSNDIVEEVPIPQLKIEPEGDITYNEGEDCSIKVTIPPRDNGQLGPGNFIAPRNSLNIFTIDDDLGLKLYSTNYGPSNADGDVFHFDERKTYLGFDEMEITFSTSIYPLSGFVSLVGGQTYEASLVQHIQVEKLTYIHPVTQIGPLPPGYLNFWTRDPDTLNDEGEEKKDCVYGTVCTIHCRVVGYHISNLLASRVLPDGTEEEYPYKKSRPAKYLLTASLSVKQNDRAVRTEKYRCFARGALGQSATHTVIVRYLKPTRIDRTESKLAWVDDQNVQITCSASGDPLPDISLVAVYQYLPDSNVTADTSHVTQDKVTVSKVVPFTKRTSQLTSVICTASAGDMYDWQFNDQLTMFTEDYGIIGSD